MFAHNQLEVDVNQLTTSELKECIFLLRQDVFDLKKQVPTESWIETLSNDNFRMQVQITTIK